jgi:hypothetical protein
MAHSVQASASGGLDREIIENLWLPKHNHYILPCSSTTLSDHHPGACGDAAKKQRFNTWRSQQQKTIAKPFIIQM